MQNCKMFFCLLELSVQFSCSVISYSLWPHRLQHTRLPYPSPTPGVCSNSCPLSQWYHLTISSSIVPFSSYLQSFPRVFSKESVLCIFTLQSSSLQWVSSLLWPKYWSFSFCINPSTEYSGLISFRLDWLDLLAVQGTFKVLSNTTVQRHQFFGAHLSL